MGSKILLLALMSLVLNCGKKMENQSIRINQKMNIIPDESIQALLSKKIFFGHMSVGYNILQGMEDIITADARLADFKRLDISSTINSASAPGFYHAKIGKNGLPKTKCDAFLDFLRNNRAGEHFDIAFFKFCYVDIERDYDINNLFDYYVKTIDQVKQEFPKLKIIHVTIPVTAHQWGIKGMAKNLLMGDMENVKRNQFNDKLKNAYQHIDPIFDLAQIESTLLDGTRSSFIHKNQIYYSLARHYTSDGGHLNESGSYYAAKELLAILAQLSLI